MKKILPVLFVLLVAAAPISAIAQIDSQENLDNFIQTYYQNPDPEQISAAISFLKKDNDLSLDSIPRLIGFFSRVFNDNDSFRERWQEDINATDGFLKDALTVAFDSIPEILLSRIGPSASWNDMCWGAFYASGDTRYLQKITDKTIYGVERYDINLFFTGSSAKWSLATNARRHTAVKEYLEDRIKTDGETSLMELLTRDPEELRNEADEILKKQEKKGWGEKVLKKYIMEANREILSLIGREEIMPQ